MEIPDVVSVRKFKEFSARQKDELHETLLDLSEAIEDIPKKSLRKTLHLTLAVLEYKGDQVTKLQEQLVEKLQAEDSQDESHNERLIDENEKLKRMLDKLEDEKVELKDRTKELTDEIFQLQKRLQDAVNSAEGSDKDSSDPLSELDKQEELLRNINTKNKHIKRLLREIEALQNQNIEQSKTIIQNEKELQHSKAKMLQLSADVTLVDSERKALKESVHELNIEITRLDGNITYLEEERDKSENDLKDFIDKLETKAQGWKQLLDEKDVELKKLRRLMVDGQSSSLSKEENIQTTDRANVQDNGEGELQESTKMLHAIESRDKLIEQLELKLKTMAEEMMASTKLMNKLSAEKEDERNPQKPRSCCKIIEESLQTATQRCRELSEMLERSEEDNALKSKQAMQAITALDAYQRGEDGLVKALRKCSALEQKLMSRDKQIRALVMELNSMHEIAHENGILRKRLNIPDDVVISTKNLAAKERSKEKIIDRLTLKLRASEEMRLQLKMEKSDLRKELLRLQKVSANTVDMDTMYSLRLASEVGEVEDSLRVSERTSNAAVTNVCLCKRDPNFTEESRLPIDELQMKYQEVLDENEILRSGMHEILEKLREYDASSDHITIDTEILYRLLQTLQTHSAPDTPKRLQAELQTLKDREEALRDLIKQNIPLPDPAETDEIASIESMREDGELINTNEDSLLQLPNLVDSSTRPTTPNKTLNSSNVPIIEDPESARIERIHSRDLQQQLNELKIFQKYYEELQIHMSASAEELQRTCAVLVEQARSLELDLMKKSSSYDYISEDLDRTLTEVKQNELRHIQEEADMKREMNNQKLLVNKLEEELKQYQISGNYSDDDYLRLQKSSAEMQTQLAYLVEQVLAGKFMSQQLQVPDVCMDYGIIRDNLQLDYITVEEFESQQNELKLASERHTELSRKSMQLEGLLEIAQDQIQSQQRLLNDLTDNHISLRHLVADLQNSAEDKLFLAKVQRDLDSAKSELNVLKMARDKVTLQCDTLQNDLTAKQQLTAQLKKDFQVERRNKNIKIKFLQKSLYSLKEKYSKFTPLIFLTNFVYAYTKFMKNSMEAEQPENPKIINQLNDIIKDKLKENNCNSDEAENVIKLIKTETQCKLFEENLASVQNKYAGLQLELAEQRVRYATESEHWQTIEALFRPDEAAAIEVQEQPLKDRKEMETDDVQMKHVATNTDAPIPAERKLSPAPSGGRRRSSLAQLVDKNMSPIGSPVKKNHKKDVRCMATQTNGESENESTKKEDQQDNLEVDIAKEKDENAVIVIKKQTAEALVQTAANVESQGVQTVVLDAKALDRQEVEEHIENELKLALQRADERERLLNSNHQELLVAQKRIEDLEKSIACEKSNAKEEPSITASEDKRLSQQELNQQTGVIEKTIISFHSLLTEKDKSISKYQDLLQNEREQSQATIAKLNADIESLKNTVSNLNFNIRAKDLDILELKTKLEVVSVRRNSNEKIDLATAVAGGGADDNGGDNSLNELSDEKIEEMFQQDAVAVPRITVTTAPDDNSEKQDSATETLKEMPALLKQIMELKDKASYSQNTLKVREEEIGLLREKLHLYQEREKSTNPETEQLRVMLEDKDKHINDLMETLNNFHDDQQRYIDDSSNYSADQISKLAANLTRTEATNKIYQTQVEALRRQLTSLTSREKQARELSQSLRNQLIKRPVVSIKTELNARVKNENLQKRAQQLELELEEARAQIQRQQIVIETKRAKSNSEVSLWEKQKRWQQNAEKFKAKLEETECTLEKTRSLLQSARTMVSRLEKDKQVLEVKLGRATHGASHSMKCCRTPSCPNLHQGGGAKYTPSESPETYTGASSECSSPAHGRAVHSHNAHLAYGHGHDHGDLIEALKARIELQQRKILAMELEGKGSNVLTTEMENVQEKLSAVDAQNIRLEAKLLQLQLDNDLLRQGDATERLQKRIKHLEDYIIALKEEIAHTEARRDLCKCAGIKSTTSAEQTILSLRHIVEKLRAENKYLKDGRRSCESRSSTEGPLELGRLQQMYSESLEKIANLQVELNVKAKCSICSGRSKAESQSIDELKFIKDQLTKKTQLLQKAKVLLTRAAAKEKVLKEQLSLWKRKCSELQNVPVIDEISE